MENQLPLIGSNHEEKYGAFKRRANKNATGQQTRMKFKYLIIIYTLTLFNFVTLVKVSNAIQIRRRKYNSYQRYKIQKVKMSERPSIS